MDCSPQGSSDHGISQARILELVAIFFSRESSQPRNQTHICVSSIVGRFFTQEAIREVWKFTYHLHCIYTVLVCKRYVSGFQPGKFKFWFLKLSGIIFFPGYFLWLLEFMDVEFADTENQQLHWFRRLLRDSALPADSKVTGKIESDTAHKPFYLYSQLLILEHQGPGLSQGGGEWLFQGLHHWLVEEQALANETTSDHLLV